MTVEEINEAEAYLEKAIEQSFGPLTSLIPIGAVRRLAEAARAGHGYHSDGLPKIVTTTRALDVMGEPVIKEMRIALPDGRFLKLTAADDSCGCCRFVGPHLGWDTEDPDPEE